MNLLKNSNSKTGHYGFLRTETSEKLRWIPDEFDTNLELLKIVYRINCKDSTSDITIYASNLQNQ
jgi:hypothetical protein